MKNYNGLLIGSGFAASVFAFGITSGLVSFKDASVASLVGIPAALITHIVTDSKAQKAIREKDSKLSKALRDLDTANKSVTKLQDLETKSHYLAFNLEETKKALDLAVVEHEKACQVNQGMKQESTVLQGQVAAFKSEIEQLQLEIEEWEEQLKDRVEVAVNAKLQTAKKAEIDRIFTEHDKITSEAMSITEAFQKWGLKVSQRFQDKNGAIEDTQATYRQHVKEFTALVTKERDEYLKQIDLLNERIAQLQQKLNGDLIEPEYLSVAYSIEGRIANDIAKEIFTTLQIPWL